MTEHQLLNIAHWGMQRGLQSLELIRTNLTKQKYQFNTDAMFTAYDHESKKRQPVLYLGDLNDFPADKQERLVWDVLQVLNAITDWTFSDEGKPWQRSDITLLIPPTKNSTLKWQLMSKLSAYYERRQQEFPESLTVEEADESEVLELLQTLVVDEPQIVIAADSLLDNSLVASAIGIANEASGSGRILSEAIAWLALLPTNTQAKANVTLTTDNLGEICSVEFIKQNQHWLKEHYQVGEPILYYDDLQVSMYHLNRREQLFNCCFPASTAPQKLPESNKKADLEAFSDALENEELLDHQVTKQSLHFYIGDCGIAKTLASLVTTLEQLSTDLPETNKALIYQETNKDAYSYLVVMQKKD